MRLLSCLSILLCGLVGMSADAGPWPREPGGIFLSLSVERDRDGNRYDSLYAEYGRTARTTLGFELGHSNLGETSTMLWWQRPLDDGQGPDRLVFAVGSGALKRDGRAMPQVQLGLGWGRGLDAVPLLRQIRWSGWLSADARLRVTAAMKDEDELARLAEEGSSALDYLTPKSTAKVDVTLGLRPRETTMLIGQLRLERGKDIGKRSKLALSVVQDVIGPVKLQAGVLEPVSGGGERAFILGSWFEF